MKAVIKALAAEGIKMTATKPGAYEIDCPKKYCRDARGFDDNTPLRIVIKTEGYGEFKCRHCLWTGHAGEKPCDAPEEEVLSIGAAPKITRNFFGAGALSADAKQIIIAQREGDAEILADCGFVNILALPANGDDQHGQQDKFSYLVPVADNLKRCAKVTLAFDDTQEGIALRTEIARRIGPGKCWIAKFSRQTLKRTHEEMGVDELCADVNQAPPLPIRGLYELTDFEKELVVYFDNGMASGVSTGWPNVDKLYTIVPGQLTVVTGIPNSGKSEWVDALSMNLALNHGWRIAAFSPENGKEAHATKLIEKRVEMSADPKSSSRMSMETFASGALWVNQHYYFIESTEVMPTLDWILERAADAALRYGIKGLIIDPWNRIEKKLAPGQNETDYVAASIPRILRFLVNHGVHGWLVVHPKQQQPDHKTGKIRAPSLYDMAGSAHFVNMCDNGIVVHRSDAIDDTSEILVKKVRFKHVGRRGETKLSYNSTTGRYTPLDQVAKFTFGNEPPVDSIQSWGPDE